MKEPKKTGILFLTYPRSGCTFLRNLFFQQGYLVRVNHEVAVGLVVPNKKIVSIVRNPLDSITSHMSMLRHYGIDKTFEMLIEEYEIMMKALYGKVDHITTYEDLLADPVKTAEAMMDQVGLEHEPMEYDFDRVQDKPGTKTLRTSTIYPGYNQVKADLKAYDLTEAYRLYNLVVSKKCT